METEKPTLSLSTSNDTNLNNISNSDDNSNTTQPCSNDYCLSDEDYADMIRQFIFPTPFEWGLITLYVVVFVVGVVGNFLVCFVVWYDRRMRTVTNLFIVNLSVADFLVILICMPTTVLGDVTETWYLGSVMCKIIQYLQGVSVSVSVLTLSVISVERFYAICYPLKFRATMRRARVIIAITWCLSLAILLPEFIVLDTHTKFPPHVSNLLTTCKPTWNYHHQVGYQLFLIVALFVLPVCLMGAAYTKIAICLWSSVVPSEPMQLSASAVRRQSELMADGHRPSDMTSLVIARRKAAKMLIAVVLMFFVCYLPVHLLNILRYVQVGLNDMLAIECALVAHWLCYFNSAINPVIYNFMSEKFQGAFKSVLFCSLVKSRPSLNGGPITSTVKLRTHRGTAGSPATVEQTIMNRRRLTNFDQKAPTAYV